VDLLASAALGQDPGLLTGLVGSVLQQGFLLKYSREQELEADRVGVGYLADAGYDPRAAIEMFRNLAAASGGGDGPAFLSSHPTTSQRIEQLERVVAQQQ
jgi:predicted Zn-dependent protease